MSGGYYYTAEPAGVCSCHACTCSGCPDCEPDEERVCEHCGNDIATLTLRLCLDCAEGLP